MRNLMCGVLAVAGMAMGADAGTSRLSVQVSKDGATWSNSATVDHNAGDTGRVIVRYAMSWIPDANDTAVPIGFYAINIQPTFANVRESDVIAPFASQGNNVNGGGIDLDSSPLDGPFGRLRPFATTGPAATNPSSMGNRYLVHTHTSGSGGAPAGRYYRIARNDITRWMGSGPTTGSMAVNNFNGSGGIVVTQKSSSIVSPNDPPFNSSIEDVVLFQIAIDVAAVGIGQSHLIDLDAPLAGLNGLDITTGLHDAAWFRSSFELFGTLRGVVTVRPAQINIIPSPCALALLSMGGVLACRRRR